MLNTICVYLVSQENKRIHTYIPTSWYSVYYSKLKFNTIWLFWYSDNMLFSNRVCRTRHNRSFNFKVNSCCTTTRCAQRQIQHCVCWNLRHVFLKIINIPYQQASLMQQRARSIVPKLSTDLHKGQCGRIGVFGGCIM